MPSMGPHIKVQKKFHHGWVMRKWAPRHRQVNETTTHGHIVSVCSHFMPLCVCFMSLSGCLKSLCGCVISICSCFVSLCSLVSFCHNIVYLIVFGETTYFYVNQIFRRQDKNVNSHVIIQCAVSFTRTQCPSITNKSIAPFMSVVFVSINISKDLSHVSVSPPDETTD